MVTSRARSPGSRPSCSSSPAISGAWEEPRGRMSAAERREHRGARLGGISLGVEVRRLEATRAIRELKPELVLASWLGPGPLLAKLIRADVQHVLEIGAGSGVTGDVLCWSIRARVLRRPPRGARPLPPRRAPRPGAPHPRHPLLRPRPPGVLRGAPGPRSLAAPHRLSAHDVPRDFSSRASWHRSFAHGDPLPPRLRLLDRIPPSLSRSRALLSLALAARRSFRCSAAIGSEEPGAPGHRPRRPLQRGLRAAHPRARARPALARISAARPSCTPTVGSTARRAG